MTAASFARTASRPHARIVAAIFAIACALALVATCVSASEAYASTGYSATATPSYRHPGNGVIEDSGGESSEVLGQSMTDGATYPVAFVELADDGTTYVTIRLKLMDNIVNPQFQYDYDWTGVFTPVGTEMVQENTTDHTADFRMAVPSGGEGSVFRCSMYVTPMGRDVIFYITLSNFAEGNTDGFATVGAVGSTAASQDPSAQGQSASASVDTSALAQAIADAKAIEQGDKSDTAWAQLRQAISAAESALASASDQAAVDGALSTLNAAVDAFNASADAADDGVAEDGIAVYDAEGNAEQAQGSSSVPIVPIVVVVVVVIAVIAGVAIWRKGKSKGGGSSAAAAAAAAAATPVAAAGPSADAAGADAAATTRLDAAAEPAQAAVAPSGAGEPAAPTAESASSRESSDGRA